MTKKIDSKNIHTEHVRITIEVKEKLRGLAYKYKLPECYIANTILYKYLDLFRPDKSNKLNKKVCNKKWKKIIKD